MTTAGDLRHRIAFDAREDVNPDYSDDLGNTYSAFVEQFVTNAAVRAKLGGETVMADRLTSKDTVNITVRQNSRTKQITTEWRARDVHKDITYAITSIIDPDDRGAWLEVLAQTGTAA